MKNNTQVTQSNRLIFLGMLLFLLGLTTGLFVQNMKNPRMGLSGHLEGVMNGMFLMILGVIWTRLRLQKKILSVSFWLVVYGTFANLAAVLIAAVTGFGEMMPIAGGKEGAGFAEGLISFLLVSLAFSMLFVCILVLTGFYRYMKVPNV